MQEKLEQAVGGPLEVTKDRLKAWSACTEGYKWFLEKFPQGGEFADVYGALNAERKYDDADWLVAHLFGVLGTADRVQQTVRRLELMLRDAAKGLDVKQRATELQELVAKTYGDVYADNSLKARGAL